MSQNLMQAYFTRDLSEAEDAELGEFLKASPAAGVGFAVMAEADFDRLGLKVPPLRRPFKGKIWAAALLFSAGLGYATWNRQGSDTKVQRADLSLPGDSFKIVGDSRQVPQASEGTEPAGGSLQLIVAQSQSGRGFSLRLKPAADNAKAEVRDLQGRSIRILRISSGSDWEWDGRDANNLHASPGKYELRVVAGEMVVSKWVEIEKR